MLPRIARRIFHSSYSCSGLHIFFGLLPDSPVRFANARQRRRRRQLSAEPMPALREDGHPMSRSFVMTGRRSRRFPRCLDHR